MCTIHAASTGPVSVYGRMGMVHHNTTLPDLLLDLVMACHRNYMHDYATAKQ